MPAPFSYPSYKSNNDTYAILIDAFISIMSHVPLSWDNNILIRNVQSKGKHFNLKGISTITTHQHITKSKHVQLKNQSLEK